MSKGFGTVKRHFEIGFIPKSVKEVTVLLNGKEETLPIKKALEKYGDYEVYSYTEDSTDKPTRCIVRVEYEYEEIDSSTLHNFIESLQRIEKEYGGNCQLYWDHNQTIMADAFSYNKTLSNMCAVYIKKN